MQQVLSRPVDTVEWKPFDHEQYTKGLYWLVVRSGEVDTDVDDDGGTIGCYTGKTLFDVALGNVEDGERYGDRQLPFFDPVTGWAESRTIDNDTEWVTHFAEVKAPHPDKWQPFNAELHDEGLCWLRVITPDAELSEVLLYVGANVDYSLYFETADTQRNYSLAHGAVITHFAPVELPALPPAQQVHLWLDHAAVLDVETTDLDEQAEVVEIAVIDQDGNVLFDSLVKPQSPISAEASAVHGITDEMVADAPSWADIHDKVCRAIGGRKLVIYNADFDMRLMAQSAARYGLPPVTARAGVKCAMRAYAEFYNEWDEDRGTYRWQRLSYAVQQQGVKVEGEAHRALADVKSTLGVLKAMVSTLDL